MSHICRISVAIEARDFAVTWCRWRFGPSAARVSFGLLPGGFWRLERLDQSPIEARTR